MIPSRAAAPPYSLGLGALVLLAACELNVPPQAVDTSLPADSGATEDTAVDYGTLRVRKNAKDLSAEEKVAFTDAILALKASPPPTGIEQITVPGLDGADDIVIEINSWYDMFVAFHQASVMRTQNVQDGNGVAHTNSAFPPWHRKLLLDYEEALRTVSGEDISLPYWDWTDQESTDAVFSPDLMGSFGEADCTPDCKYAVMDGPFAKGAWVLDIPTRMPSYEGQHPFTWLVRAQGINQNVSYTVALPTAEQVAFAITITDYDVYPYNRFALSEFSFRNYLEGFDPPTSNQYMHNIGHDWVSGGWIETIEVEEGVEVEQTYVGTMEPLDISPSDPVFFLHHANVDRIWASWQLAAAGRLDTYVPVTGGYYGWNRDDAMYPYRLFTDVPEVGSANTPGEFLDFMALGYEYGELVK